MSGQQRMEDSNMGCARLRERYVYPGMALAAIGLAAALAIGLSVRPAVAVTTIQRGVSARRQAEIADGFSQLGVRGRAADPQRVERREGQFS